MANDKHYTVIHTPLGELWIAGNEQGLTNVSFPGQRGLSAAQQWSAYWVYEPKAFAEASGQLTGYAGGLHIKQYLSELEGVLPQQNLSL
jgi:O6-methylguanine-DNA--protein-cysteine methyltransferase